MRKINCNIDKGDRINRMVFGIILCLGALAGFGKFFLLIVGLILIIEGAMGWCAIPYLMAKARAAFTKK